MFGDMLGDPVEVIEKEVDVEEDDDDGSGDDEKSRDGQLVGIVNVFHGKIAS